MEEEKKKKFVCAICEKYVLADSKYDEVVREFAHDFGVDIDEFDDSDEVCVIARCKECAERAERERKLERFRIYDDYNDLQSPKIIEVIEAEKLDMFCPNPSSTAYLVRDIKQNKLLCIIYYTLNPDSYFFVDHINRCIVTEVTPQQWKEFKETGKLRAPGIAFG